MLKSYNKLLYRVSFAFFDMGGYFARDLSERSFTREIAENLDKSVLNPNIDEKGLKKRLSVVSMIGGMFYVMATIYIVAIMIPLALLSVSPSAIVWFASIVFYLLGTAIFISLRRGCLASLDVIKYKFSTRNSAKDRAAQKQFKINCHAAPQLYDLLPGIIVAILALMIFLP